MVRALAGDSTMTRFFGTAGSGIARVSARRGRQIADLSRRNLRPLTMRQSVLGVWPALADTLEYHRAEIPRVFPPTMGITLQRLVPTGPSATRNLLAQYLPC